MKNQNDEENNYDYSPNDLAELSINDPRKYREIIESNLDFLNCNSVEEWENKNLKYMQNFLKQNK